MNYEDVLRLGGPGGGTSPLIDFRNLRVREGDAPPAASRGRRRPSSRRRLERDSALAAERAKPGRVIESGPEGLRRVIEFTRITTTMARMRISTPDHRPFLVDLDTLATRVSDPQIVIAGRGGAGAPARRQRGVQPPARRLAAHPVHRRRRGDLAARYHAVRLPGRRDRSQPHGPPLDLARFPGLHRTRDRRGAVRERHADRVRGHGSPSRARADSDRRPAHRARRPPARPRRARSQAHAQGPRSRRDPAVRPRPPVLRDSVRLDLGRGISRCARREGGLGLHRRGGAGPAGDARRRAGARKHHAGARAWRFGISP